MSSQLTAVLAGPSPPGLQIRAPGKREFKRHVCQAARRQQMQLGFFHFIGVRNETGARQHGFQALWRIQRWTNTSSRSLESGGGKTTLHTASEPRSVQSNKRFEMISITYSQQMAGSFWAPTDLGSLALGVPHRHPPGRPPLSFRTTQSRNVLRLRKT